MGQGKWTKRGQELSLAGIKYWRADWLTATHYVAGDGVHSLSTGKAYICILEHNSNSAKEPGVGADWRTYWDILVDGANQIQVEQTAHGFTGGEYVKSSGVAGEYDLAQADTEPHASGIGFVTEVDGVDNFTITQSGYLKAPTIVPAQTAGTVMYLDPATPGAITATKPTTPGQYIKPVAIIIESAVSMWILSDSPRIVAGSGSGSVESVTSSDTIIDVDNSDPDNPVLSLDVEELANDTDFIDELTNNASFQTQVNTFVSGGGGEAVKKTFTKVAHGFSVGDVLKSSGTDGEFNLAQADVVTNADAIGIVTDVPDVDTFVLTTEGFVVISALPGGAVTGDNFYLSDSVAGALTLTDPAIANVPGTVSFPLGTVIDDSTGLCNIHKYRPQEQQSTPVGSGAYTINSDVTETEFTTVEIETPVGVSPYGPWTYSYSPVRWGNGSTFSANGGLNAQVANGFIDTLLAGTPDTVRFSTDRIMRMKFSASSLTPSGTGGSQISSFVGFAPAGGSNHGDITVATERRVGFAFYNGNRYIVASDFSSVTAVLIDAYTEQLDQYMIQMNGNASADFYINGVLVGTISTDIPTGSQIVTIGVGGINGGGGGAGFSFISNFVVSQKTS